VQSLRRQGIHLRDSAGETIVCIVRSIILTPNRLLQLGTIFGPIMCIIIAVEHWFFWLLEWWVPEDEIERVQHHWTHERFKAECAREQA
jgi:hypothetical protein